MMTSSDADDGQNLRKITGELLRKHLTPREEMVIRLRFGIDTGYMHTLDETAIMFNVSGERILQMQDSALNKLQCALMWPPNDIADFLMKVGSGLAHPVPVSTGRASERPGERIPPPPSPGDEVRKMRDEVILKLKEESSEVSRTLANILEQAGDRTSTRPDPSPCQTSGDGAEADTSLDPRYKALLEQLCRRQSWDRKSFEKLVREHGFMVSDAIDTINEWADEALGDFLIEDGDPVVLDLSLLRKALDGQTH